MRTELHTHLLPAVDDGPASDAEALALACLAVADGTRTVVATPHVSMVDISELPERVARLGVQLRDAGIPLDVRQGGELSPRDVYRMSRHELDAVAQGPAGRRWLLLEAPLSANHPPLAEAAQELRRLGYGVLIAHPERSTRCSMGELIEHVERGSVIQINASSLAAVHGSRARRAGIEIARAGLPFVLASDAHSTDRPPMLGVGAKVLLSAGVDSDTVRVAVETGPEQLLRSGLSSLTSPGSTAVAA
jgi:protein-tyrosine phosphatase